MNVVAIYNMKGGVGKTTTAVNLSYLEAASGRRTLLWDLDPQAAASFAFRVRPRVDGFGRRNLQHGDALAAAIKETDYRNLDLLPADFAYRKIDRLLGEFGNPQRVVGNLIETLGRDYDTVVLDCPAGFSLLIEGVLGAADVVLVPTIPTVLSLRMVARLIKWADREAAAADVAAFFSMVDRRKALHRLACESAAASGIFIAQQIPYASIVEQMTVRRMPLALFAPREAPTEAFAAIHSALRARLDERSHAPARPPRDRWSRALRAVEALVKRLETGELEEQAAPRRAAPVLNKSGGAGESDVHFVHTFDTERRDVLRGDSFIELREGDGRWLIIAGPNATGACAEAQIDNVWAAQILSGEMSPLEALEYRLGSPLRGPLHALRAMVGGRRIVRTASRTAEPAAPIAMQRLAR